MWTLYIISITGYHNDIYIYIYNIFIFTVITEFVFGNANYFIFFWITFLSTSEILLGNGYTKKSFLEININSQCLRQPFVSPFVKTLGLL